MGAAVFALYGLVFGALTIRHVSFALLAIICMFAFEQWGALHIVAVAENGTLVNLCIIVLAAIAWFRLPPGTSFEFLLYPNRLLLMLLMFYAMASTLWSPTDADATTRFMDSVHYNIAGLLIAPLLVMTSRDITRVLDSVNIVGGLLVILFAYVPTFEGRSMVTAYNLEEMISLPLTIGDFAGWVMLISIMRMRARLWSVLWSLLVFGSALFLITKTGSRGQLIFGLAALLICLPAKWKNFSVNKVLVYLLLGLLAAAAFAIVTQTENTLSSRMQSEYTDSATQTRVEMATALLDVWVEGDLMTLIFGLGSSASWSPDIVGFYPHVIPLEILGELGFLGFILFSLVVMSLFLKAYSGKQKRELGNQELTDFSALFACFVFALLISCKQGTLIYSMHLMMYAALAEKSFVLGTNKGRRQFARKSFLRKSMNMRRRRASEA